MNRLTVTGRTLLKARLVRLCGRPVGEAGAALLEAQIAALEKTCASIHHRIDRTSEPRSHYPLNC